MKQIIQNYKTGELKIEEVPIPTLKKGGLLVKTVYSLISAGTERMKIETARMSLAGKAKSRPQEVKKVIESVKQQGLINTYRKVMNRLDAPAPLGYSTAGIVLEVGEGVDEFKPGDRTACAGAGYANHAEVNFVPRNLCVKVPENLKLDKAAFTTIGAIALQGIRQADVHLGEKVAVIGLGLVGQLCIQILKASGCEVVGIDVDEAKVRLSKQNGADLALVRGKDGITKNVDNLTNGYGVDAIIITTATKSNDPIELSAEISRDRGKIVDIGITRMEIPWKPYYEKELDFKFSRSYGPGRYDQNYEEKGMDYPIGYVRWTEKRNMEEFLNLLSKNKIDLENLITHRFKFEEAEKAYGLIAEGKEHFVGVLFEYPKIEEYKTKIVLGEERRRKKQGKVNLGVIGAGNFGRTMLLPHLKKNPDVNLLGIATATGMNAQDTAKRFGFGFAATDHKEIMDNPDIGSILIATRHNLHAQLVIEGLRKGKNVYTEKPLAISEDELNEIIKTMEETKGFLMVGFNRRFSPYAEEIKRFFAERKGPLVINYRVNAGFIPRDNWYQDPEQGGRIIGEGCHFVDFLLCLTGSLPVRVFAEAVSNSNQKMLNNDNVNITIKFNDGSVGTISYLASGDTSFSKERVEVFGEGKVAVLDNFKSITLTERGRSKRKNFGAKKGHKEELISFVKTVKNAEAMPIDFKELIYTTLTTFKAIESINKGLPVEVKL